MDQNGAARIIQASKKALREGLRPEKRAADEAKLRARLHKFLERKHGIIPRSAPRRVRSCPSRSEPYRGSRSTPSGPRRGQQLWFFLECGHTVARTFFSPSRSALAHIRCPACPPKEKAAHAS